MPAYSNVPEQFINEIILGALANGNPSNIGSIYTGTVTDFTQTNRIIYRPPLMDPKTGEVAHSFMRTVHTDSKWLNGKPSRFRPLSLSLSIYKMNVF